MESILELRQVGSPKYIDVAKMAVGSLATKLGFDMEKIEEIEMAMEEGCKLMTCHGQENWCAEYTVKCYFEDNRLTITIQDSKKGKITKGESKCCLDCPNEGELSIHVIKSLMDNASIEEGNTDSSYILMSKGL